MRLVKDPETEAATQAFWDIVVNESNLNKAIRHMDTVFGIQKDWKSWKRMTQSDFYCGIHRGVEDYCEPYVTPEDFVKVQERKFVKGTSSGSVYLFRTLMRCPECKHILCGDTNKKSYGAYKSYRCTNRSRGCSFKISISEKKLEKYLLNNLEPMLRNEIAISEAELAKPKPKPKTDVKKIKERQRRLNVMYMAGNKSDEEYLKEDADLKAQIAAAEAELPPPPRDVAPLKKLLEYDFKAAYEIMTEESRQQFWQDLLGEIILDGKKVKKVKFFEQKSGVTGL